MVSLTYYYSTWANNFTVIVPSICTRWLPLHVLEIACTLSSICTEYTTTPGFQGRKLCDIFLRLCETSCWKNSFLSRVIRSWCKRTMSRDFHTLAIAANRAREFDIEELNDERNQWPSNKQNVFQCLYFSVQQPWDPCFKNEFSYSGSL